MGSRYCRFLIGTPFSVLESNESDFWLSPETPFPTYRIITAPAFLTAYPAKISDSRETMNSSG
ncbi:hypothetical protein ES707_00720 [subsurface metagenome]